MKLLLIKILYFLLCFGFFFFGTSNFAVYLTSSCYIQYVFVFTLLNSDMWFCFLQHHKPETLGCWTSKKHISGAQVCVAGIGAACRSVPVCVHPTTARTFHQVTTLMHKSAGCSRWATTCTVAVFHCTSSQGRRRRYCKNRDGRCHWQ